MFRRSVRRFGAATVAALVASLLMPVAAQARVPGTADTGEVYALTYTARGLTGLDIFTPAPGVTSAELYRRLRRAGEVGLIDPSTLAGRSLLEPGDCSIDGAWAVYRRCGTDRLHWARLGSDPRPKVYFQDSSSAAWPVTWAVPLWNQSAVIDSRYQTFAESCPATASSSTAPRTARPGGSAGRISR
jgi:hypothetical protein